MPARRLHVTPCGDLETPYTDVRCCTLLLYLQLERSVQDLNVYLTRRSSVGVTGFEPWSARTATQLGPGRPHFAPHTRNVTKVIQSNDSQLGKPVNRLLRGGFAFSHRRSRPELVSFVKEPGPVRGPSS
jgi:hypothetical protein